MNTPAILGNAVRRWAGLSAGAVLWAISVEAGQILTSTGCSTASTSLSLICGAALLLSLLAAGVSFSARRAGMPEGYAVFAARLGCGAGLTFAFALALQTAAMFLVDGCQR